MKKPIRNIIVLMESKKLFKNFVLLFAATFFVLFVNAQVSEDFDKPTLCSGVLGCWEIFTTAGGGGSGPGNGGGPGNASAPILPLNHGGMINTGGDPGQDPSLCSDPTPYFLDLATPITGTGSLRNDLSTTIDSWASVEGIIELHSVAYGNDGDNVSVDIRLNNLVLCSAVDHIDITIYCGNFSIVTPLTTADIGNVNT
jgi:hypothetical protein